MHYALSSHSANETEPLCTKLGASQAVEAVEALEGADEELELGNVLAAVDAQVVLDAGVHDGVVEEHAAQVEQAVEAVEALEGE
eukprot:11821987-Alexandrium_andersonii.AAC.1